MPRENKTKYAVLGLLAYGPLSGYDIKRIYAQSLGNFWSESYGHIYPILKRLEEEGLATREVQHHTGKPDRNVYTITEAGRAELHRWLAQPPEPVRERVELLLKLFHGWEIGPEAMIEHVKQTRAQHVALLERYAHYDKVMTRDNEPPSPYWNGQVYGQAGGQCRQVGSKLVGLSSLGVKVQLRLQRFPAFAQRSSYQSKGNKHATLWFHGVTCIPLESRTTWPPTSNGCQRFSWGRAMRSRGPFAPQFRQMPFSVEFAGLDMVSHGGGAVRPFGRCLAKARPCRGRCCRTLA